MSASDPQRYEMTPSRHASGASLPCPVPDKPLGAIT